MNPRLLGGALLPFALAACASAPDAGENLAGTQWKLMSADRGTLAPLRTSLTRARSAGAQSMQSTSSHASISNG